MATAEIKESKMHRYRVGDKVSWDDGSEFPPVHYEGDVKGFDNDELTYLIVDFDGNEKVLTEDEVTRIG